MARGPSAAVAKAMAKNKTAPAPDKLKKIRDTAVEMRKLTTEITELDAQRRVKSEKLLEYQRKTLPDLMIEAGIDTLGITDDGNLPPYDIGMTVFYSAKIPDGKEGEAAAWLEKNKHGDLLKTSIDIAFGMGDRKKAKDTLAALKKLKVDFSSNTGIHSSTLKAFVKEQIEEYKKSPPVALFGISTGKHVSIKERKEKATRKEKD